MNEQALVLAGVALEIAQHLPDEDMDISRAEWRHKVVSMAQQCIDERGITIATDDVDEEVVYWLMEEKGLQCA